MEYPDRLKKLKMPTLKYRRLRGDMIETFKIITGIYDNEVTAGIIDLDPNTRTRGHSKKIKKKFCKINLRKFSFTNRIVDLWNSVASQEKNSQIVTLATDSAIPALYPTLLLPWYNLFWCGFRCFPCFGCWLCTQILHLGVPSIY
jgi:hypothetical protein